MSLDERDYMRERHRRLIDGASAPSMRRHSHAPAWRRMGWLLPGVVLAVLGLLAVWRGGFPWAGLPKFPRTGEVLWVESPRARPLVPLTVDAPPGQWAQAVVLLRQRDSDRPVAMVPLRAGERARVGIPTGRYRVTMIRGVGWRGPGRWFLWTVSTHELSGDGEIARGGQTAAGYRLSLVGHDAQLRLAPAA